MFKRNTRSNEMARNFTVAAMVLSMAPSVFGAGTNTYRFTNNEGRQADDIHIRFSSAMEWDTTDATYGWQSPAATFKTANGSGTNNVDMHVGAGGAGVAAGASVDITLGYGAGNTPQVREWWWTENHPHVAGKTKMLGLKKQPPARDVGFEYISIDEPGELLVSSVAGEATFVLDAVESGIEAAARFAAEMSAAIPDLEAMVDPFDAQHVLLSLAILDDNVPPAHVEVLMPCSDCITVDLTSWGSQCDFDYEFEGPLDGRSFWEHWAGGPATPFEVIPDAGMHGSPGLVIQGADDAVLNLQTEHPTTLGIERTAIDRGRWIATASFRASDEAFGADQTAQYFILMNEYPPTSDSAWSLLIEADPSRGVIEDRDTGAAAPFPAGQWSTVQVEIDLDTNRQRIFVNGELLEERAWAAADGQRAIAAVDIYGYESVVPMAWDEVHVVPDLERGACMFDDGICVEDVELAVCTEFEGQFMGAGSSCTPDCPADIDGDGLVATTDLLLVLAAWGSGDPAADVDGDGLVGTGDLLAVLAAWGTVCG